MDKIAVIDYGGQYAHLISTVIREIGVYSEILLPDFDVKILKNFKGLILSGSPALSSQDEISVNSDMFTEGIPVLGFCFGHQEIAKFHGGKVVSTGNEYGMGIIEIKKDSPVFKGLDKEQTVWMSHGDSVVDPGDMEEIAISMSPEGKVQKYTAIASDEYKHYGFQFHPEVDDTPEGREMIKNFVIDICGCKENWNSNNILKNIKDEISGTIKDKNVFMFVSGGVDSTVAAVILSRILNSDRLRYIHIDTGLMRKNESKDVLDLFFIEGIEDNLKFINAENIFLEKLKGIYDPEEKRKIIGNSFVEVLNNEVSKLHLENFILGQGTIYPDRIETGATKYAHRIKTHHNRVEVIEEMIAEGRVIEPLKDLYKSEVREIGYKLGISEKLIKRHPFPGPGLGVRCICSDGKIDKDFQKVEKGLSQFTSRYNACLLPVKSVGVKGDMRSYEYPAAIWGKFINWEDVENVSNEIFRRIQGINRVIWLEFDNEELSITTRESYINKDRLNLLREADYIANELLEDFDIYDEIWQMPVISLPLCINGSDEELVVIRPVISKRGMTARFYRLPDGYVLKLKERLKSIGVNYLGVDVSSKPPATIEWE